MTTQTRKFTYWEDVIASQIKRFGPLLFTTELLEQLLELLGEKHPIHDSDDFAKSISRKGRIVPGGFVHSMAAGHVAKSGGAPLAIVGIRNMVFDFVRPLYVDMPFYFTNEIEGYEETDERMGTIRSLRRFFDEDDRTITIIRTNYLILRRPANRSASVSGVEIPA
jgi:acyl dehydratase